MAKINFNVPLKDMDGDPIKENNQKSGEVEIVTMKQAVSTALMSSYPDEKVPPEEKLLRHDLAHKVYKSKGQIELTIEELGLIKKMVDKAWGPMYLGQIYNHIEGKG